MKNYFISEREQKQKIAEEIEEKIKAKEKELRQLKTMRMVAKNMKSIENFIDN